VYAARRGTFTPGTGIFARREYTATIRSVNIIFCEYGEYSKLF